MRALASMEHNLCLKWYRQAQNLHCHESCLYICSAGPHQFLNRTIHLMGYISCHNAIWTNQFICHYTLPSHIKCSPSPQTEAAPTPSRSVFFWEPLTSVHRTLTRSRDRLNLLSSEKTSFAHLSSREGGGEEYLWCEGNAVLLPAMIKDGVNLLRHHSVCQSRINSRSKFSINFQWFTAWINYIFTVKCPFFVNKYTQSFSKY